MPANNLVFSFKPKQERKLTLCYLNALLPYPLINARFYSCGMYRVIPACSCNSLISLLIAAVALA